MRKYPSFLAMAVALALGGCADMSPTEQRVLSGGAIGASGGAILGAIGGNAGLGAVAGGAAGLLGGYVYDQHERSQQQSR